jgi:type I restriction enzyme S subunit
VPEFAHALFTYLQKSGTFSRIASRTTSIAHLGVERFARLTISLPTIPEQNAIAKMVSHWDRAIEKTRKLIDAKKRRKKALMQQLLTGKSRLKGFVGRWKKIPLNSLFNQVSRPVKFDDSAGYNLISVRRRSGGIFPRGILRGADIKTKNMYLVHTGDFLISKMQIVHGASAVVEKEHDRMHISGSYIVLKVRDGKLSADFLKWLSRTPYFYHLTYLASYGVHIEKMTFNLRLFLKSEVEIPTDIEEQQGIADVLNEADHEIRILEKKLAALEKQKRGLMQKLLTGEVRVKVNQKIHDGEPRNTRHTRK